MNYSANTQRLIKMLEDAGALWQHDGNPKRPYALLTSGKISDFYFNGSKVIEKPLLLSEVVEEVLRQIEFQIHPGVVLGPAVGAIPFVYEMARSLSALAWFAEKSDDGSMKIARFESRPELNRVLLGEDVITTGGSTFKTLEALWAHSPNAQAYAVACIVNRSGRSYLDHTGLKIYSLLEVEAKTWERGNNPFTPDGAELIEPVRPKQHWAELTKHY